jgi:hypothetical protein
LIYTKIDGLFKILEDKNSEYSLEETNRRRMNFENWLYTDLQKLKRKISELSDVMTVDNHAWGSNSAYAQKKANLIKLTVQELMEKEKMSKEDAHVKASFLVNSFEEIDNLIGDRRREIHNQEEIKSEADVRSSDFFQKAVKRVVSEIKPRDVYEPVYFLIKKNKLKVGAELHENTSGAFKSHSPWYGYNKFVEAVAVMSKLEELGLIKKKREWAIKGRFTYELVENDVNKIRTAIFKDNSEDNQYYDDAYFDSRDTNEDSLSITSRPF